MNAAQWFIYFIVRAFAAAFVGVNPLIIIGVLLGIIVTVALDIKPMLPLLPAGGRPL
jgi:hypothetical protein